MTTMSQSTKRKLSLLQLAEELSNVSKACKIMGYHRDTFYEVQKAFKTGGVAALVEERRGPRNPHPNRVPEETERETLDFCLQQPIHGAQRTANDTPCAAPRSAGNIPEKQWHSEVEFSHNMAGGDSA